MAEVAKSVWQEVKLHMELHGLVSARRLAIADRYARSCAEYQVLHPVAAEEGPVLTSDGGGEYFNYRWSAVEKLNDRISKFEKALCLTQESVGDGGGATMMTKSKTKADSYLAN